MKSPHILRNAKDLAGLVQQRRKRMGLSQSRLAGLNGMSRFTLVDLESAKGDPKLSTMITFLESLGLRLVVVPSLVADRVSFPDIPDPPEAEELLDPDEDMDLKGFL